ncbi:MAG: phosphoribosylanthranilate isomerase [Cytophagales bacterium]|nr:phosphoribosylanthranilate isomerase [Cytophagales bacterium]MDW8384251.1 phosphoribosylanthranilate isomerase [Flammeovirgaceae bacterium]
MKSLAIKVCGMKYTENIKKITELPIDFIGFIFYAKSPRFVENLSAEVVKNLPCSIKRVGVFVNATKEYILEKSQTYELHVLQLHGQESPDFCREIKEDTHRLITKAFGISSSFDFNQLVSYEDCVDFFLFDTSTPQHGGSGMRFSWEILQKYNSPKLYFLSGGIGLEHIQEILQLKKQQPFLYGIDINSRFEESAGLKNFSLIQKFVKEIKELQHVIDI